MPVRLIAADDWRPSSMMERRLLELEREGLLRPRTSSSRPEWIAPAADHREPRPPTGYVVSFAKFHRHGLGAPPSRFMWALCHHYGVELQHFSPNAVTAAAVFVAVCEGYLGMMPHWDLWLHLYQGELFNAPGGSAGVRKPVRAGCLNLVLKTGKSEMPREYIPVGLTSKYAGWDSQWFYLRNDDNLLPAYTGCLISEHPEHWKYGVVQVHQSRLDPPRRLEETTRGRPDRRSRPLGRPSSEGSPVDVSAVEDGQDGSRRFVPRSLGVPDVQRGSGG